MKLLFWIGIFLLADGLLSVYYGNNCLNVCPVNSDFGNMVRYIRAAIGGILIYHNK